MTCLHSFDIDRMSVELFEDVIPLAWSLGASGHVHIDASELEIHEF